MSLEVIYVVRHGFRSNWTVNPSTGEYTATILSPTGIPADPALTSYGVSQSKQLAAHLQTFRPPIERVFSSPYYRCLQTVGPFVSSRGDGLQIRAEPGLGEWYGSAPFLHPAPATRDKLKELVPAVDAAYAPLLTPTRRGETVDELHARVAAAVEGIVARCDAEGVKTVLLCTHAAAVIALGRVLTGDMPAEVEVEDFRAFTCGLSSYRRRRRRSASPLNGAGGHVVEPGATNGIETAIVGEEMGPPSEEGSSRQKSPQGARSGETSHQHRATPSWAGGVGIGGGWDCLLNSDCSFLEGGEERGWRFAGDEAFINADRPGVDAGAELGFVVEGRKKGERASVKGVGDPRL